VGRRVVASLALAVLLLALPGPVWAGSPRAEQWGLERVRAPEAWPTARGEGAVVAVLDTGVHLSHPDLAPRLLRDTAGRVVGRDLVDGGAPQDEHGHGTLVAGVVAAAADAGIDGPGMAGVAPEARILPVRVLDAAGRGRLTDVDAAIRWSVDQGADVINLSLELATPLPGDLLGSGLDRAVRYAWDRGVVVVAAAGNSGTPFTDFRSSTPVLLVGATDREDRRATFSDGGRSDMVMAPGVGILSTSCVAPCGTDAASAYARASGTSFAAPHVAAAVALLRSAGYSPAEAVSRLRTTAVRVPTRGFVTSGHGRIDVAAAAGDRATPEATPTPAPTAAPDPAPAPGPTPRPPDSATPAPPPEGQPAPTAAAPRPGPAQPARPSPAADRGAAGERPLAASRGGAAPERTSAGQLVAGEVVVPRPSRTPPTGPVRALAGGLVSLAGVLTLGAWRRTGAAPPI
jgi:subtilisin family serine protease